MLTVAIAWQKVSHVSGRATNSGGGKGAGEDQWSFNRLKFFFCCCCCCCCFVFVLGHLFC